jgi:hypothetical protein
VTRRAKQESETIPGAWTRLEVDQHELQALVSARLGGTTRAGQSDVEWPVEPPWVREALEASWPRVMAMVDAVIC